MTSQFRLFVLHILVRRGLYLPAAPFRATAAYASAPGYIMQVSTTLQLMVFKADNAQTLAALIYHRARTSQCL
jgi:hypothetical protein